MSLEPWKGQRVGNLRERVTIRSYTLVDDGYGNEIPTWSDLATVSARAEPLKGEERVIAGGLANPFTALFHIRHRDDVTADLRLVYRGDTFNIKRVWNPDERRRFLTLECEAGA